VLLGVVINQGVGPTAVDNLWARQRSDGLAEHTDVLPVHRWNGGGEGCEEAEREGGTRGVGDSHFDVRKADEALEVGTSKMVTVGAMDLAGVRG
jgi:hypothetical protein